MNKTVIRPTFLLVAVLVLSLILGGGYSLIKANAAAPQRATWLWDTTLIKKSTPDILTFMSDNGVNLVYLQIDRTMDAIYYKDFIRQASAKHIQVHALDGNAAWALVNQRPKLNTLFSWIANYQAAALPEERFQGIHLDIEPYQLPTWKTNQKNIIAQWQSNVQYTAAKAKELHLPIAADVPFWLYTFKVASGSQTLTSWMLSQYDSLTYMTYRDKATGIFSAAKPNLLEGAAAGKPVYAAVETNNTPEGSPISFYEEGAPFMNGELTKLQGLVQDYTSYAGIAIHDYTGWKMLIERSYTSE
ncbi:hypothetical protein J2Z69_001398 [Paenibacillus shirakamiensis]|uniref:Amidase n=1 Tax=Paenibacillus shirakamiensis TaxID=1265935 RepID=A0ABS4JF86_9BACL|nr:hypothetical protein [Paenibacillus shirakamiensis]MBP2000379.1 hypothetical protein [Paenibacillus shirakamiensis]